jgi:glycosyltransferase involved in cell wall biosynthesis
VISVVLPTYNASKFIGLAIESMLKQTYQDFELIVVDDGSTDDTLKQLQVYLKDDVRLRIIPCEHAGLSAALNIGIREAKYPWIARMDADDIALPERLEQQVQAAVAQPRVVAWGTYAYHINSQGKKLGLAKTGPTTEQAFDELRRDGHLIQLIHPTVLLNREVVLAVGGYKSEFEPVEELELFDRMAAYGPTLALPVPLLLYRVHAQSVSMQRFFFQRILMRYVVARHRSRLAGHPDLTLEQFMHDYQHQPWLTRFQRHLRTSGMFYYRKAGLSLGEGHSVQASFYLGLSMLLSPSYSMKRVWQQVLSPKTRQQLRQMSQPRSNSSD